MASPPPGWHERWKHVYRADGRGEQLSELWHMAGLWFCPLASAHLLRDQFFTKA